MTKQQLDKTLQASAHEERLRQWGYQEFVPIADAMDALFEEMGWLNKN